MNKLNFKEAYNNWSEKIKQSESDFGIAMKKAIGGEFDANGKMERDILIQHGLTTSGYVIDIGCGSGRLSSPLSKYLTNGRYLGTDVVRDFIDHAKSVVDNERFKFELIEGIKINEVDFVADIVCFFSVFTHLLHEETFYYLQEAKRVLKPNGKIIFSFLEFYIPSHWLVFQYDINHIGDDKHLNMFISRNAIEIWAKHLDLNIDVIYDGDKPHIKLTEPIEKDDGTRYDTLGTLGQSICVLSKK